MAWDGITSFLTEEVWKRIDTNGGDIPVSVDPAFPDITDQDIRMTGRFAWTSLAAYMEGAGAKSAVNAHVFNNIGKEGWLAHPKLASYVTGRWSKHADKKKHWVAEARKKAFNNAAGAGGAPP